MPIDKYKRYQKNFVVTELYPHRNDGLCRCGCGVKLTGRKTSWASENCSGKALNHFHVIQGVGSIIRQQLFRRDGGQCCNCGKVCAEDEWDADHIIEVKNGGGGCGLENLQTLCKTCHKAKTKQMHAK